MTKHLVRKDGSGIYVDVGGWKTRPIQGPRFGTTAVEGQKVTASHSGGPWARVNGEDWEIERPSDATIRILNKYA
jgi:hypothetical protein